jgi:hypothetical protein
VKPKRVALSLVAALVAAIVFVAWLTCPGQSQRQSVTVASSPVTGATDTSSRVAPIESSPLAQASVEHAPAERAPVESCKSSITLTGVLKDVTEAVSATIPAAMTFTSGDTIQRVDATAARGYSVEGLSPGRVSITARADGFAPLEEIHELSEQPWQRLNLFLRPLNSISVRLTTPDGSDLSEALDARHGSPWHPRIAIVATRDPPGESIPLARGPRYSRYASGALLASLGKSAAGNTANYRGIFKLADPPPLYVSACRSSAVLCTQPVSVAGSDVTLTVPIDVLHATNGSVHLRIVDASSGEPLETARAELTPGESNPVLREQVTRKEFDLARVPLVGGDALLADYEPGVYSLDVAALDHEHVRSYVRIAPGGVTELGSYRLTSAGVMDGEVRDESGAPVAHARVQSFAVDSDTTENAGPLHEGWSDSAGHFELRLVGRRSYVLRALTSGSGTASVDVDARHGDVHGVVLALSRGTPVTLELRSSEAGWDSISIFDERHILVVEKTPIVDERLSLRLTPGKYFVEAETGDAGPSVTETFVVGPSPVEIRIPK